MVVLLPTIPLHRNVRISVLCVVLFCICGIVVMGICLRRFGLNINVGWDICLF